MRLSKLLVHEKDINIIWKGPIANHSFLAILTSLCHIDLQVVSLRLKAAKVDMCNGQNMILIPLVISIGGLLLKAPYRFIQWELTFGQKEDGLYKYLCISIYSRILRLSIYLSIYFYIYIHRIYTYLYGGSFKILVPKSGEHASSRAIRAEMGLKYRKNVGTCGFATRC